MRTRIFGSFFHPPTMTTLSTARRLEAPVKKGRDRRSKEQRKAAAALTKVKRDALTKDLNAAWEKIDDIIDELSLKHSMKQKKVKKLVLHLSGPLRSRKISDYNVFSHITKLKLNKGARCNT